MMEKQYQLTCFDGNHVHILTYEEMVKLFGKNKVEKYDLDPAQNPLYVPSCMECDEEAEQQETENDIRLFGLEMAAHDSYYYD